MSSGRSLRSVLDPVPSRVRERPLLVGTLLLVTVVLLVFSAVTHNIPLINGKPGYAVEADFAQVNQINDRTPVRVRGVEVGTVERVKAGPDPLRSSRMTLRVTDEDVTVHEDARATIRWRTVLGGSMYVDLEPGSPRAGELDGAIPRSQTASQVELDDILRVYDGQTEQRQRDTFRGLADGFSNPEAFGEAIRSLPALRTVARGLEPLRGRESGDLRRAVAATATTVEALGADIGELQGLVSGARRTFGATRARREELGEFLERSPATLDSTKVTMRRVRTTLDRLDPLARELRPGVRELRPAVDRIRPALSEAEGLLTEIQPILRDAGPTFRDLGALSDAGAPIFRGLEPTVDRLNATTIPYLGERDERTRLRLFEALGPHFSVLDMAGAEFDAEGFRLHLTTLAGSNSVLTTTRSNMARSCRISSKPSQSGQCDRIASVLTHGWFGGGREFKP